jgi:hypothetical protein
MKNTITSNMIRPPSMGIPVGGQAGRGDRGGNGRGGVGHTNRRANQLYALDDNDDEIGESFPTEMTPRFYNRATPWCPPINADDSIFHETVKTAESLMSRSFTGTLEIYFTVGITDNINVSTLIKRFLSFDLKTYKDFHIQPLQGDHQSIA